jgi:hypothetical protein
MTEKKPYTRPQLFLSACSLTTMTASQGGNGGCRPTSAGGCKRRTNAMNADSGARPS